MSPGAEREHFDMLPFIAILMCTLGALLYVTMIVASLCIGPGAGEGWLPVHRPGEPTKEPVLVEWDGEVAIVHRDGERVRVAWDGKRQVTLQPDGSLVLAADESSLLGQTVAALARKAATHYVLFAVRPSGFANFNRLADEFRRRKLDIGYEPIEEGRPVRLLKAR